MIKLSLGHLYKTILLSPRNRPRAIYYSKGSLLKLTIIFHDLFHN